MATMKGRKVTDMLTGEVQVLDSLLRSRNLVPRERERSLGTRFWGVTHKGNEDSGNESLGRHATQRDDPNNRCVGDLVLDRK